MATSGTSENLLRTSNFAIEIDSITVAFFQEVTGLTSDIEVITHQVVNKEGRQITQKLAGRLMPGEVTFKKTLDGSKYMGDWFKQVQEGKFDQYRRNGSIILFDEQGTEAARWNFIAGWPKSWSGSNLNAGADEIVTESVIITHEGMTRG